MAVLFVCTIPAARLLVYRASCFQNKDIEQSWGL